MRDQDLTLSLDTPENISVKIIPEVFFYDTCGTWRGLQNTQHPKKHKKQSEIGSQVS